jgi:putative transcriptional regulator
MMDNAWLITEASEQIIFDTPLDERWTAATRNLGMSDSSQIAGYAGHA